MEDRGKTIMCGVLFLDIVEYSKKSVSGQISLKERFNAYLSVAIRDVPIDDRIILDTGDGAALSFLGDVGDALQVALSMRESLREGLHMEPPLLVRMGINLGPVRLVKDINGQPNIVGDGINVAQRIMAFADPGQILVSRPYYDAVSRLSSDYAGMFHYQGSRTDKHVREHEIYAIGYPGEFTSTLTLSGDGRKSASDAGITKKVKTAMSAFRSASPILRAAYIALISVPVIAISMLISAVLPNLSHVHDTGRSADSRQMQVATSPVIVVNPSSAVVAIVPASAVAASAVATSTAAPGAQVAQAHEEKKSHVQAKEHKKEPKTGTAKSKPSQPGVGTLVVSCMPDTSVFVDGKQKGKTGKTPLSVQVDSGRHLVMLITRSTVHSEKVDVDAHKTVKISPGICR